MGVNTNATKVLFYKWGGGGGVPQNTTKVLFTMGEGEREERRLVFKELTKTTQWKAKDMIPYWQ